MSEFIYIYSVEGRVWGLIVLKFSVFLEKIQSFYIGINEEKLGIKYLIIYEIL